MACFYCQQCDQLLDGDWVESYEWGSEEICIDCHVELTPEDWEDYKITYDPKPIPNRNHDWEATHNDYDPPDARHFTGRSLEDVWAQVIEYNEEKDNDHS